MPDIQFQYPQALWLLALLPVWLLLFVGYLMWRTRAVKKMGDPQLVRTLFKGHSKPKTIFRFVLFFLAFAMGCIAIANPRIPEGGDSTVRKGIDMVFVLDVSNSMLATDVEPSRLAKAKSFMTQSLKQLPDNRVGMVIFAGQAYVQLPLTTDYSAAQLFINAATPEMVEAQGTAVGDALQKAELAFASSVERYKAIVLITDGETHDEAATGVAQELSTKGIIINTVGIGSVEGTTIIDPETETPRVDAGGSPVISKLNEAILKEVATVSKGDYIHLQETGAAVQALTQSFATADKKALLDTSLLNYNSLYLWLVVPMLFFLLAEMFFPERKKGLI
jgi:Ca-activated chloride channel family protein